MGHHVSIDGLEQEFDALEASISARRAQQLELIRTLDQAQVASMDAYRSLDRWLAARFDIRLDTARSLVRLSRVDDELLETELSHGHITTDRADAEARLIESGADDEARAQSRGLDLAGIERLASRHRHLTPAHERDAYRERFLVIQRQLDGARGRFWGEAPSFELDVVETSLDRRADHIYESFGNRPPRSAQRLDALVSLAQDALTGGPGSNDGSMRAKPIAVITVDAGLAAKTDGEAGAELLKGGRVGPNLLDRIRCSGMSEVNVRHPDGPVCQFGRTTGALSPRQVRRVLARDEGMCQIDGCTSTYGLEPHHLTWRADGGTNDDENLATLCWAHHHIALHGEGRQLDPATSAPRLRFRRRAGPDPPTQSRQPSSQFDRQPTHIALAS